MDVLAGPTVKLPYPQLNFRGSNLTRISSPGYEKMEGTAAVPLLFDWAHRKIISVGTHLPISVGKNKTIESGYRTAL